MKIGLLIETASGGSGKHFADLAAGLTERGHCVHVLYSPLRSSNEFRKALTESGASIASTPMKRSIGFSFTKELVSVRSWLRTVGPLDVLHAHSTKAGLLLRALSQRSATARLYSPHAYRSLDVSLPRPARIAAQVSEVRLLGGAGIWTIAVGDLEYEHAAAVLGGDPRLRLVRNGLLPRSDRSGMSCRKQRPNGRRVVWAGRLAAQKDPLLFVETIRAAPPVGAWTDLVMFGDGPLAAEVDAAVSSLGPANKVRRMGWVDDLPEQLGPQDVLVVTSRYEAAPYLFLEAAAAGAWIVTLDVGGVEELARHYQRITVLPQGSKPSDIAAALVEAQNSGPAQAPTDGLGELLSIDRMVEQTLRVYQEAIEHV